MAFTNPDGTPKKPPQLPPKKATKDGYYTIEPRPFNYGEYEFMQRLVEEFTTFSLADHFYAGKMPPARLVNSSVWIDTSKKNMAGKKTFTMYADSAEKAEFVDYLLNKLDLVFAQALVEDIVRQDEEERGVREVIFNPDF